MATPFKCVCDHNPSYFQFVHFLNHVIFLYTYLESVCHDEQNGVQSFVLRPKIAELWQLKACKVDNNHKQDCIAFFKAGL